MSLVIRLPGPKPHQPIMKPIQELEMIDDAELARRSILGLGEMFAALGRGSVGPERALASQAGRGALG